MRDITENLIAVMSARAEWTVQGARRLMSTLATLLACDIDWDEGAGEGWARLLQGERVLALIWISAPLVIVEQDQASLVAEASDATVSTIVVTSFASAELSCDPAQLVDAFDERSMSAALDPTGFSAEDLWFATV